LVIQAQESLLAPDRNILLKILEDYIYTKNIPDFHDLMKGDLP
jgi:hypothetical protein